MKFKVNFVKTAVLLTLGLGCFGVEVDSRTVFAQNAVDSEKEAKLNEYRELLKKYIGILYDKKFDDVSDSDRMEVAKLAEKLREFKKQIEAVPPERLDDYVCDFIERDAGRFNVVNKEEFKNLGSSNDRKYLWQVFDKDTASHFKNGEFKLDWSYNYDLRGGSNCYRYRNERSKQRLGGKNLRGGLLLQPKDSSCEDFFQNYSSLGGDLVDEDLSRKFEISIGELFEVLGFSIDLEQTKQIDLERVDRYSFLLMLEYPEEFGFVDEVLSLKPIIQKHDRMIGKEGRCVCCWHDFRLSDFFDYGRQVESETQKELFGESMFDLNISGLGEEELKKEKSELQNKMKTLEYAEKLRANLLKANKKSHITNKNYYLLKNYALLAKLLGYDVIVDKGRDKESGDFIVLNARKLSVCSERMISSEEMKEIQGK